MGVGVAGGVARKRTYADMTIHHHHQHHHHPQHHHGGAADLIHTGLEAVGLAAIGMGEEGLQGHPGLGLEGISGEDLGQARIDVPALEAAGIGHGSLDPTGMGSADHLGHGALGQRGLETADLDAGENHHHHGTHHHHHDAMVLQPVLPAHVVHPGSIVGPSDKMFH